MEPTYTIEVNGDTLFILCDPDRPFEEVDHEDLWFNHLQQYDDITNDKSNLRNNVKDYRYRLQKPESIFYHQHERIWADKCHGGSLQRS